MVAAAAELRAVSGKYEQAWRGPGAGFESEAAQQFIGNVGLERRLKERRLFAKDDDHDFRPPAYY
ncbi:hypothetical protein [Sphingomonas montanisoli]|uniref:Uncharacterized protein n=1 Tax=Sphingomonas montanisoli TaxID=2606412 RepID=A0A5D9CBV5_9SPHN|nr:hypothetical protein [Sphingomonas montanisoli]TZG28787.1 hypothetical protein FYJ91_01160 [Sphingomonas montanisoli]